MLPSAQPKLQRNKIVPVPGNLLEVKQELLPETEGQSKEKKNKILRFLNHLAKVKQELLPETEGQSKKKKNKILRVPNHLAKVKQELLPETEGQSKEKKNKILRVPNHLAKVKQELLPENEGNGQDGAPKAKRVFRQSLESSKRRRTRAFPWRRHECDTSSPALAEDSKKLPSPSCTPSLSVEPQSASAKPPESWYGRCPTDAQSSAAGEHGEAMDFKLREMELQIAKLTSQRGYAENRLVQLKKLLDHEQKKRAEAEELCATLRELLDSLNERLHTQKSMSSFSQIASWQFQVDGGWEAFTAEGNAKMHHAYMEYRQEIPGSRHATIVSGGVARAVDFERMEQQHLQTLKVRPIRLSAGGPSQWTTPAVDLVQGKDLESFYIEVSDQDIWNSIQSILQNSGHALDASSWCSCMSRAEVKSVHRIENIRLWHRYKARLAAMRQDHTTYGISVGSADLDLDGYCNIMAGSQQVFDCGEALDLDVDEKILLHGTSWENANSIVREGFDHRTCQHALYGAGVYFACATCKSHQYTCKVHKWCCGCHGERTLIISRVALGDSYLATETRQTQRRPPVRFNYAGTHDSIVVNPGVIKGHHQPQQVHQEFVIFDREQAYPSYVVQYSV